MAGLIRCGRPVRTTRFFGVVGSNDDPADDEGSPGDGRRSKDYRKMAAL
jgi:hypothetical protein